MLQFTIEHYLSLQVESYKVSGHDRYSEMVQKVRQWIIKYNRYPRLDQINKDYVAGWVKYLQNSGDLGPNTVLNYFNVLNTMLNMAVKEERMAINPITKMARSERPHGEEHEREFLTLGEVQRLAATPCRNKSVGQAFLFSCFTGLRLSDIEELQWSDIHKTDSGWQIDKRQHKTQVAVHIPLSQNALAHLPARSTGRVWEMPIRVETGRYLRLWMRDAGIDKHITFHCSRHTYATLLLTYGADLYTVSKILGHTDIATTQIYAKVVDKKRQEAVELIPAIG